MAGGGDAGEFRLARGTASTAPRSSPRTRNFPRPTCSAPAPSPSSSTSKGKHWRGKRWDKYFLPGKPYLDGYQADFMTGQAVIDGLQERPDRWPSSAASPRRSATIWSRRWATTSRSAKARGSPISWSSSTPSTRPSTMRGCGARSRSRSIAGVLRRSCRARLSSNTSAASCGRARAWRRRKRSWSRIPGFSPRHRRFARRGEAAARRGRGARSQVQRSPSATSRCRITRAPIYWPRAGAQIGVTATQDQPNIWDWQKEVDARQFDVALDFSGDFYRRPDDPADQIRVARSVAGQLLRLDRPLSRRPLYRPGGHHRSRGSAPKSSAISSDMR